MNSGYPVDRERTGRGIVGPSPGVALYRYAPACQPVDSGEGKAFGFSVVPPQAAKDADVFADLLIDADAKAVLERAHAPRRCNVRRGSSSLRETNRLGIVARV